MTPTHDALIAIVVALRAYVLRWIASRVHNAADAEDITQTAIIRAVVSIRAGRFIVSEGVDLNAAVRRWLVGVALHAQADWYAARWRRFEVPDDDEHENDPPVADCFERIAAREKLRHVMGRLNRAERAVMFAVANGETLPEIADARGWPRGTVASKVRRTRGYLKRWG